jgi:hypothetical protein
MAAVQVADIIVPSVFTPYTQQITMEKARLVQSGVLVPSPVLNTLLAGGGKTFDVPSFQDLDASDSTGAENVSADDIADIQAASFQNGTPTDANRKDAVPKKLATSHEVAARLCRNQFWSSTGLARELAGDDPAGAIATRVAYYWTRRLQKIFINVVKGVIADNLLAPGGSDTHTQYDLINDISGVGFVDGVTNFSAEAFIDAAVTMGDSADLITTMMVHSIVFARMQKNNLLDFIPDARGETLIPTFLAREVIVDDSMPKTASVYDTWLFGPAAVQVGEAVADVATEVYREPQAGKGGGQEILATRRIYACHPTGYAYVQGSIPDGGPANSDLAAAANWGRRYPERKQIRFAVLRTREA